MVMKRDILGLTINIGKSYISYVLFKWNVIRHDQMPFSESKSASKIHILILFFFP